MTHNVNDRSDLNVTALLDRIAEWERRAAATGRETVDARVDAGRARIETLRMQAHLAGMDSRDKGELVFSDLETRLADTRARLVELADEASDVWTVFSEAFESARNELVAGEELLEDRVAEHRVHHERPHQTHTGR